MNDIIETKYLRFERQPAARLTTIYKVTNRVFNTRLGEIKWYAPFRKYSFFPEDGLVFDEKCLTDVAGVLKDLTLHHLDTRRLQAQRNETQPSQERGAG